MKKIIITILIYMLVVCMFTGCSDSNKDERPTIVCTVFPIYDWVRNIVGENDVNVVLLMDSGADLHNYSANAAPSDQITIGKSDLFIYIGGESDKWVDKTLEAVPNDKRIALNLMSFLGADLLAEDEAEIIQEEEHEEEHEEGEHEEEYDEHIWTSLKNASALCKVIAQKIALIDPDHADSYTANALAYREKLHALDAEYALAVQSAPVKKLVFADRFPFLYMTKDYNIGYKAAFAGCNTETNAKTETITTLAEYVDQNSLKYVIAIDGSDKRTANSVIGATQNKNQEILTLNSLQTTTKVDVNNGATYLAAMQSNLVVLKKALS